MSLARTQLPVLFVEDDPALLHMFSIMLRRFGIDIDTADSFASARDYLETNAISGLITDHELGDGKGTALAEFALQRNPNARIAIVSGGTLEIPASLQDRVTLLQKPFSQDELRIFLQDFPRAIRPA
jgi:DNA-binding NtrC family response regulator